MKTAFVVLLCVGWAAAMCSTLPPISTCQACRAAGCDACGPLNPMLGYTSCATGQYGYTCNDYANSYSRATCPTCADYTSCTDCDAAPSSMGCTWCQGSSTSSCKTSTACAAAGETSVSTCPCHDKYSCYSCQQDFATKTCQWCTAGATEHCRTTAECSAESGTPTEQDMCPADPCTQTDCTACLADPSGTCTWCGVTIMGSTSHSCGVSTLCASMGGTPSTDCSADGGDGDGGDVIVGQWVRQYSVEASLDFMKYVQGYMYLIDMGTSTITFKYGQLGVWAGNAFVGMLGAFFGFATKFDMNAGTITQPTPNFSFFIADFPYLIVYKELSGDNQYTHGEDELFQVMPQPATTTVTHTETTSATPKKHTITADNTNFNLECITGEGDITVGTIPVPEFSSKCNIELKALPALTGDFHYALVGYFLAQSVVLDGTDLSDNDAADLKFGGMTFNWTQSVELTGTALTAPVLATKIPTATFLSGILCNATNTPALCASIALVDPARREDSPLHGPLDSARSAVLDHMAKANGKRREAIDTSALGDFITVFSFDGDFTGLLWDPQMTVGGEIAKDGGGDGESAAASVVISWALMAIAAIFLAL